MSFNWLRMEWILDSFYLFMYDKEDLGMWYESFLGPLSKVNLLSKRYLSENWPWSFLFCAIWLFKGSEGMNVDEFSIFSLFSLDINWWCFDWLCYSKRDLLICCSLSFLKKESLEEFPCLFGTCIPMELLFFANNLLLWS